MVNKFELNDALEQLIAAAEERGYNGELSDIVNPHIVTLKAELDDAIEQAKAYVIKIATKEET